MALSKLTTNYDVTDELNEIIDEVINSIKVRNEGKWKIITLSDIVEIKYFRDIIEWSSGGTWDINVPNGLNNYPADDINIQLSSYYRGRRDTILSYNIPSSGLLRVFGTTNTGATVAGEDILSITITQFLGGGVTDRLKCFINYFAKKVGAIYG